MATDTTAWTNCDSCWDLLRRILIRLNLGVTALNGSEVLNVNVVNVAPPPEVQPVTVENTVSVEVTNFPATVEINNFPADQLVLPTRGTLTDRSGTVASGGNAQTVMAANSSRLYLFFENVSNENLWINFGTAAVAAEPSLKIVPNGGFAMEGDFISTESVSVIGATTGSGFTAKEG